MKKKYLWPLLVLLLGTSFLKSAMAAPIKLTPPVFAAQAMSLEQVRTGITPQRVRIVFQFNKMPHYMVSQNAQKKQIILRFDKVSVAGIKSSATLGTQTVQGFTVSSSPQGTKVVIDTVANPDYHIDELSNPSRIFIDISREYETKDVQQIAPGLIYTKYFRHDGSGNLTAYLADVDPSKYELIPVLGGGRTLGKNTVQAMAEYYNAPVAINSSYFGGYKTLYGLTMIDGTIASTTYLPRTAFGINAQGKPIIATVTYNGSVHTSQGDFPLAGVNCSRTDNSLVAYNSFYGNSTGTENIDGSMEYTVEDGHVTKILTNDSPLGPDSTVLSARGTMAQALKGLKVGDAVTISNGLEPIWQGATQIVGVGPRLLRDGKIDITSAAEQIGGDVTWGRAPRTAVGITAASHVLMLVVDGRQAQSRGLTLQGLAELLLKFGARDAVNFDGGGSSEMVVNGDVVNSPSDGSQRYVGASLAAVPLSAGAQ